VSGDGLLVGGEPLALLGASTALHEAALRTRDVGARLVAAVAPAASTIHASIPYAPAAASAALVAMGRVAGSPTANLGAVAASLEAVSMQLRSAGQALEAAGAVGLLASGGLGLLRGERPTILPSAEGIDLQRQAVTGSWSSSGAGGSSTLGVREVQTPDGRTIYVVEATMLAKEATSAGLQVNGFGAFAEAADGQEVTLRWAVATEHDARLMAAVATAALAPNVGRLLLPQLPKPTETVVARTASVTLVGGTHPLSVTSVSGTASVRGELTKLASGGQRYVVSVSGAGQAAIVGVTGAGGAASVKVTVDRDPAGTITKVALSTTTELDRGRHGLPPLESFNREVTLVERDHSVELDSETGAAAHRIAAALTRGEAPAAADIATMRGAAGHAATEERTYDVRRQQVSADVALARFDGGGGAAVDTAVLRR
jgi:hypothetical protein